MIRNVCWISVFSNCVIELCGMLSCVVRFVVVGSDGLVVIVLRIVSLCVSVGI